MSEEMDITCVLCLNLCSCYCVSLTEIVPFSIVIMLVLATDMFCINSFNNTYCSVFDLLCWFL